MPVPTDSSDAANVINLGATQTNLDEPSPTAWWDRALVGDAPGGSPPAGIAKPTVEARIGHAVLRLRLYWGWSQRELQRRSGVHQSQISRLESGSQHGLSTRRLFAILRALRVGDVAFLPPEPVVPPTALELMLHGDPWERATLAADRRVNRRRSA